MSKSKAKPFPELVSDATAEAFVAEADLSDYDWSDMKQIRFEFAAKDARKPGSKG
jgi:predicted DNA binding CopG/RHH family protein